MSRSWEGKSEGINYADKWAYFSIYMTFKLLEQAENDKSIIFKLENEQIGAHYFFTKETAKKSTGLLFL
jgi:hypothetical protein